jgi:hypothetical protein
LCSGYGWTDCDGVCEGSNFSCDEYEQPEYLQGSYVATTILYDDCNTDSPDTQIEGTPFIVGSEFITLFNGAVELSWGFVPGECSDEDDCYGEGAIVYVAPGFFDGNSDLGLPGIVSFDIEVNPFDEQIILYTVTQEL